MKCSEVLKTRSLAEQIGIITFVVCLLVAPFSLMLSVLLLLLFSVLCLTAPFFPGFEFFLPVISRGPAGKQAVALTFDDGPHPDSTPLLLNLLSKHRLQATFFVTGSRVEQFPHLIQQIVSKGHTIGNHSYSHDNFIMLKGRNRLKTEIEKTQEALQHLGVFPLTCRPPVGVTNPILGDVLQQMGLYAVNFSRRAGDMGNRRVRGLAKKILKQVRSGDIIMLHDCPPRHNNSIDDLLNEVEQVLTGIRQHDLKIIPLAVLIDREVMVTPGSTVKPLKRLDLL